MMTPVFGPDASVLLTFDWNLNGDLGAVLLVLLLAVLLWDLVTVWHCVGLAVLLRHIVVLGNIFVVAFLFWDALTLLSIVI
jgi:hypothetical protein